MPGYVPGRVMQGTSRALCRQCHRTRSYGSTVHQREDESVRSIRRTLEQADLALLVVDILDFEGTFSRRLADQCGRRFFLVANKVDLLPGKTPHAEVVAWLSNRLASMHVSPRGVYLISATKGIGTAALWDAVKKELSGRGTAVVVGVEGVGKTTLMNNWVELGSRQENKKKRTRRKTRKNAHETGSANDKASEVSIEAVRSAEAAEVATTQVATNLIHQAEDAMPLSGKSAEQSAAEQTPVEQTPAENGAQVAAITPVSSEQPAELVSNRHSASLPIPDAPADSSDDPSFENGNANAKAVNPPTKRRRRPSHSRRKAHKEKTAQQSPAVSPAGGQAQAKSENANTVAQAKPENGRATQEHTSASGEQKKNATGKPANSKRNRRSARRRSSAAKKAAAPGNPSVEPAPDQSTGKTSGAKPVATTAPNKTAATTTTTAPASPEAAATSAVAKEAAVAAAITTGNVVTQPASALGQKVDRADIKVIDAPGIPGRGRITELICDSCARKMSAEKALRSKVLRMKPGQAVILAGAAAISIRQVAQADKTAFLLLFTPPAVAVQRVRDDVVTQFLQSRTEQWRLELCNECSTRLKDGGWEETEVVLEPGKDLAVHGLGWLSARQRTVTLRVVVPVGTLVSVRPGLVGPKDTAE